MVWMVLLMTSSSLDIKEDLPSSPWTPRPIGRFDIIKRCLSICLTGISPVATSSVGADDLGVCYGIPGTGICLIWLCLLTLAWSFRGMALCAEISLWWSWIWPFHFLLWFFSLWLFGVPFLLGGTYYLFPTFYPLEREAFLFGGKIFVVPFLLELLKISLSLHLE